MGEREGWIVVGREAGRVGGTEGRRAEAGRQIRWERGRDG